MRGLTVPVRCTGRQENQTRLQSGLCRAESRYDTTDAFDARLTRNLRDGVSLESSLLQWQLYSAWADAKHTVVSACCECVSVVCKLGLIHCSMDDYSGLIPETRFLIWHTCLPDHTTDW